MFGTTHRNEWRTKTKDKAKAEMRSRKLRLFTNLLNDMKKNIFNITKQKEENIIVIMKLLIAQNAFTAN
jgi:hypothetical protein